MIKLALSAPLFSLIPEHERERSAARRTVALEADCWENVVSEVRSRFPDLAGHALTESGAIAAGFVLVVNDEVMPRSQNSFAVTPGDELSLIAAIAGG